MSRSLTEKEISFLQLFAWDHGMPDRILTDRKLLEFYFSCMKGVSEHNEQLYSWFRLREDAEDDYLRIAIDIVDEYGKEYLSRANIIEVGSGLLPNLSERLLQLVHDIDKITVYDPALKIGASDLKLHPNRYASRIVLNREEFTLDTPIEDGPTLIISRHPCGATPVIIDTLKEHKELDLYVVLCDCNDLDMHTNFFTYHRDRGEETPNFENPTYSKIRLFGRRSGFEHNWQQYTAMSLRKIRPDLELKVIRQENVDGNVVLTKPTTLRKRLTLFEIE
jgi:hypothetical protein